MNNKSTRVSAMVAGLATFLCATLGFAQDFGALRAQGGANCANVSASITSATATCPDWVNVAACITVAAGNDGPACTTMSAAALLALSGARSACNTQAGRNASQAAEIADLDRRLQACRNQRPAATARRPVHLPICLSEDRFGNAATVFNVGRTRCVVQMNGRSVVSVLSGSASVCAHPDFTRITRPGCYCEYGQATQLGTSSSYYCGAVATPPNGPPVLVPPSGVTPQATTNAEAMQQQIDRIITRLNAICLHVPTSGSTVMVTETVTEATATADGASASAITTSTPAEIRLSDDCADARAQLNNAIFRASGNGGQVDTAALDRRVADLETTVAQHTTEIQALRRDVDRIARRQVDLSLFGGVEARRGIFTGSTPVFGVAGLQLLWSPTAAFSVRLDLLTLYGRYDAPMVETAVGYGANIGFGLGFKTGERLRHDFHLMFSIRNYRDTGYHEVSNINRGALLGDDRGWLVGGRLSYMIRYRGFGFEPSVTVGAANVIHGNVVRRGNERVADFREATDLDVNFGAIIYWGLL